LSTTFSSVAKQLAARYGNLVPSSIVQLSCERFGISVPGHLPYVRTGKRGGRLDISGYLSAVPVRAPSVTPTPTPTPVPVPAPSVGLPALDGSMETVENRFAALDMMAQGVADGHYRALIVSGNPGIGKTYTLEKILKQAQEQRKIKSFSPIHGFSRATGIFRLLYENRTPGKIVLFDDCDSVFSDEIGLNLFKAALDTTERRVVSWYSEKPFVDDDGTSLPKSFEYDGTVVFVTNKDFEKEIGGKLKPHLEALLSRSYYLDLHMRSEKELFDRIEKVTRNSRLLADAGLPQSCADFLLQYVHENAKNLREVSLRTVVKLATIYKATSSNVDQFRIMADAACCKRKARLKKEEGKE
jgi:hypothetical protein